MSHNSEDTLTKEGQNMPENAKRDFTILHQFLNRLARQCSISLIRDGKKGLCEGISRALEIKPTAKTGTIAEYCQSEMRDIRPNKRGNSKHALRINIQRCDVYFRNSKW
jgi:hypothetical protein